MNGSNRIVRNLQMHLANQRGAALIVSLIILMAMSIVGVGMMQTSTLEERMAANVGDSNLAFQRAELALRTAEDLIESEADFIARYGGDNTDSDALRIEAGATVFAADCSNGRCYTVGGVAQQTKLDAFADDVNSPYYSVAVGGTEVGRYLVEFNCQNVTGSSNCVYIYTIMARGFGNNGSSQVTLEEIYRTE
ncbi:MAG: hypothetical protein DRH06_03115 [Deltaproteobacteria bacterium]|nr:MAG: hypothetical protein DRH07_09855 [Deltaproteobacteria bacterium]RLB77767.1 MAG: hypothetical protein DRH06_03115 [Deltaproteobacteria bacterium]